MGREPKNKADKFLTMRVNKDLREAFTRNAEKMHGEAAASRLRTLMYNDLPAHVRKTIAEPQPTSPIDQSYRKANKNARSEGGTE